MKRRAYQPKKPFTSAVHYKHDLGQHFLYDMELLRSLIQKINVTGSDCVLEIGAGAGTLTRILCEAAAQVIAVEVDEALLPGLQELTAEYPNLTIIHKDIRKLDLRKLFDGQEYRVVANIPYSITSQIFDLFWGTELPVRQMSVTVQKEVADKLTATPGDKAYGLMSVRCRYYCEPEITAYIPAAAFTPQPKVDSAFVNLKFRNSPPMFVQDEALFWRLVKASYKLRRKTLLNAMKTAVPVPVEALRDILTEQGLAQSVRGEELSIMQWITLSNAIESVKS